MIPAAVAIAMTVLTTATGGLLAPVPAAPAGTTIASLPVQTCADVSTSYQPGFNGYVYGAPCTGSPAQIFRFKPLTGAPAGTYQITNTSSGQCLVQQYSGVKQHACTSSVPPDATDTEWTLTKVGTTGFHYRFVVTTTATTSSPTCLQVYPRPRSHPGPVLLSPSLRQHPAHTGPDPHLSSLITPAGHPAPLRSRLIARRRALSQEPSAAGTTPDGPSTAGRLRPGAESRLPRHLPRCRVKAVSRSGQAWRAPPRNTCSCQGRPQS